MLQVSPVIWNEIAATQNLVHPEMRRLMSLPQDQLPKALDALAKTQESAGASPRATLAYATVAPLLLENQAISRYIQMKDNDSLRASLPELTTVDEATSLATQEYRLNGLDQKSLKKLLNASVSSAPN